MARGISAGFFPLTKELVETSVKWTKTFRSIPHICKGPARKCPATYELFIIQVAPRISGVSVRAMRGRDPNGLLSGGFLPAASGGNTVVVVGDSSCGKTQLINRFANRKFSQVSQSMSHRLQVCSNVV